MAETRPQGGPVRRHVVTYNGPDRPEVFVPRASCFDTNCIVVDATGPLVVIRSTVTGGAMTATHEEWAAFLDRAKTGEFDANTQQEGPL